MASKNTICLWYEGAALDAARFYAETFPDSAVGAVMRWTRLSGENPPNTTEWIAPIRAQASIA